MLERFFHIDREQYPLCWLWQRGAFAIAVFCCLVLWIPEDWRVGALRIRYLLTDVGQGLDFAFAMHLIWFDTIEGFLRNDKADHDILDEVKSQDKKPAFLVGWWLGFLYLLHLTGRWSDMKDSVEYGMGFAAVITAYLVWLGWRYLRRNGR